jgi:hypothetical protein
MFDAILRATLLNNPQPGTSGALAFGLYRRAAQKLSLEGAIFYRPKDGEQ